MEKILQMEALAGFFAIVILIVVFNLLVYFYGLIIPEKWKQFFSRKFNDLRIRINFVFEKLWIQFRREGKK